MPERSLCLPASRVGEAVEAPWREASSGGASASQRGAGPSLSRLVRRRDLPRDADGEGAGGVRAGSGGVRRGGRVCGRGGLRDLPAGGGDVLQSAHGGGEGLLVQGERIPGRGLFRGYRPGAGGYAAAEADGAFPEREARLSRTGRGEAVRGVGGAAWAVPRHRPVSRASWTRMRRCRD